MNNNNKTELLQIPVRKKHLWNRFVGNEKSWLYNSGDWQLENSKGLICHHQQYVRTGENIALFGKRNWEDYDFSVKLKIFSNSTKPPEGGVIVYYQYKNSRNYYSIHFCVSKQKIEIIKRLRGKWITVFERDYPVKKMTEYEFNISIDSGFQLIQLNGKQIIRLYDEEFLSGNIGLGVKYCDAGFRQLSISAN